jgi:hypothetical protein
MAKSKKKLILPKVKKCIRCNDKFVENLSDAYCDDCYMYISQEGNRG